MPPVTTIRIWLTREAQTYRGIRALEMMGQFFTLENKPDGLSNCGLTNKALRK
jgi:hypothetical protein